MSHTPPTDVHTPTWVEPDEERCPTGGQYLSEGDASLYGICPFGHPRAVWTELRPTGKYLALGCPTCDRAAPP